MARKCIHAYFKGVVQGVGFRFTARALAYRYKIKGWVKNLADGRVELVVDGQDPDIDSFFKELLQDMKRYITDYHSEEVPEPEDYDSFQIKF